MSAEKCDSPCCLTSFNQFNQRIKTSHFTYSLKEECFHGNQKGKNKQHQEPEVSVTGWESKCWCICCDLSATFDWIWTKMSALLINSNTQLGFDSRRFYVTIKSSIKRVDTSFARIIVHINRVLSHYRLYYRNMLASNL